MAEGIKEKAAEAGHKIAETAKTVGHKIAEGAEKATDWVKEKAHIGTDKSACSTAGSTGANGTANIREHMEVIAACGMHVGVVDHVEGTRLKLTRSDAMAGGEHHFIPLAWVTQVDQHVHLNKNAEEVFRNWTVEPARGAV